MKEWIKNMIAISFLISVVVFVGCHNSSREYREGEKIPFCVIEDKDPRIVCVNSFLKIETVEHNGDNVVIDFETIIGDPRGFETPARCHCSPPKDNK